MSSDLVYKQDTYQILSKCFEVHRVLGHGFLEAVYKDALEVVFQQDGILYTREKEYAMSFRNVILPHQYYADFVVMDKIILEVKCITAFTDFHIAQTINYLKASGNKVGLLVNFGRASLEHKSPLSFIRVYSCNPWLKFLPTNPCKSV